MRHSDNLRHGRLSRSAWILVPAALAIVATSGVVSRPAMRLGEARTTRARAEERLAQRAEELHRSEELARLAGTTDLAATAQAVRDLVPGPLSSLDTHGLVVLAARRAGLALESIEIGDPTTTTFQDLGDRVLARRVDVKGVGSLESIASTVDALRSAGLPVSVSEATLARSTVTVGAFEVRMTLSFHHRVPADSTASAENRGDS